MRAYTNVVDAAKDGDLAAVKRLFRGGFVSEVDSVNAKALEEAALAGHTNVTDFLAQRVSVLSLRSDLIAKILENGHSDVIKIFFQKHRRGNPLISFPKTLPQELLEKRDIDSLRIVTEAVFGGVLSWAARENRLDVVEQFMAESNPDAIVSALMTAVTQDHKNIVKYLIKNGNCSQEVKDDTFIIAITHGHIHCAKYLAKKGTNPDAEDGWALVLAASRNYLDVIEWLIGEGISVDAHNGKALQDALRDQKTETVRFLLQHSANASEISLLQQIAHWGASTELVMLLLPCHPDFKSSEADEIFINVSQWRDSIALVDYMASKGVNEAALQQALSRAVSNGIMEMVEHLVDMGVSVDDGQALIKASSRGYKELAAYLISKEVDVNAQNENALYGAAVNGHVDTVKLLLESGANQGAISGAIKVAQEQALLNPQDNRLQEIITLLQSHGQ